jgi:RNA polymerase sigma-70 factor, ECF subfamily
VSTPTSLRLLRLAGRPTPAGGAPAPDALADADLVALALARDPRAGGLVWDRYARTVHGVLQRALGPGHDVEDRAQDVFLVFFRNVESLRDPSALRPFLIGIALRTARTELRKRRVRRWLHLSPDGDLPEVPTGGGEHRARAALRRLYAVLDTLSDRERLAFVLRHAEGYELTETASLLGVSLATVKRVLSRAEARVEAAARDDDLLQEWTEQSHA